MALVVLGVVVFWKAIPLQASIPVLSIIYLNIGYCVGKFNLNLLHSDQYNSRNRAHPFLYFVLFPLDVLCDDGFFHFVPDEVRYGRYEDPNWQRDKIRIYLFFMVIGGWWFKIIWNIFTTICWCIINLICLLVLVIISPSKVLCPCSKERR
jgi:hypothetical protein